MRSLANLHISTRQVKFFLIVLTGTTWPRETVWQICNNGESSNVHLSKRVPPLDFNRLLCRPGIELKPRKLEVEALPSPRLLVSHLPHHVIPRGESEATKCKYIYIARNPMDVAVSGFFFQERMCALFPNDHYNGPLEWYLKLFFAGKCKFDGHKKT